MRRVRTVLSLCAAGCALLVAAACASHERSGEGKEPKESEEQEIDVREITPEAKVRLLDALHAALAAKPGEAIEAELEGEIENGAREVAFEVAIVDEAGVAWTVAVDPATGKVASVEKEDNARELEEIAEKREAAGRDHLRLGGLLERAMKHAPHATPVKITFAGRKSPGKAKAKLLRAHDDVTLTLDAKTGAVVETNSGGGRAKQ